MGMPNSINQRFASRDVGGATFTLDAEASNEITVAIQLLDVEGRPMQKRAAVHGYLSSDANGDTLEAVASGLTLAVGTDGIVIVGGATNVLGHHHFMLVSEADGDIDLSITETGGADVFYVVLILPNGDLKVSQAITFAA